VLISGRGSNLSALLSASRDTAFPAEIACVVANNPQAQGLQAAAAAGVPVLAVDHRDHGRAREAHERAIQVALDEHRVEFVCLAGYMRLLTPWFVGLWQGRMLNIHPSLLPAFPGLETHARAIEAGAKIHGCTVHLVTETMDEGPILGQAAVPVLAGDDADLLAARVLAQEHRLYPAVLKAFLQGGNAEPQPGAHLMNPLPAQADAP
jgi:formyltetrahydrofolate-dependent phosphoribosylglycinamide formyltransferase